MLELYLLRAPKPADTRRQENVLSRLRRALASATRNDPAAAVHVFGSAASGFGSSSSDIDVCLQLPREQGRTDRLFSQLRQAKAELASIEQHTPQVSS